MNYIRLDKLTLNCVGYKNYFFNYSRNSNSLGSFLAVCQRNTQQPRRSYCGLNFLLNTSSLITFLLKRNLIFFS